MIEIHITKKPKHSTTFPVSLTETNMNCNGIFSIFNY